MQLTHQQQFSENTPFFHGHFDTQPIVPGVVWLQAVEQLVTAQFADWVLIKVVQAKFLKPITPAVEVSIAVDCDAARYQVSFRLVDPQNQMVANGKLQFKSGEADG